MVTLVKPLLYDVIPASPGTEGSPYVPAQPARTVVQLVEICDYTGCTTTEVFVTIPASEAIAAVPPSPPSEAVVTTYYDRQWNSAADSIAAVSPGSYIEFKVQYDSYAVFVGLDAATLNSTLPSAYRYGLMVDSAGVRIFENGVSGALLATNSPSTTLRIVRHESGQVYYHVLGQSLVASPQAPIASSVEAHGYGLLYSSLDAVTDARVAALDLTEIVVPLTASTGFSVKAAPRVAFDVATDLQLGLAPAVLLPISTGFSVEPGPVKLIDVTLPINTEFSTDASAGGRGAWTLPAVQWLGADYDAPGLGTWRLPRLSATGVEQVYVPADPDEGFWIVPRVAAWGTGLDEDHGSGAIPLSAVAMLGAEEGVVYGQGAWTLPVTVEMDSVPPWWPDNTLLLVSELASTQTLSLQRELVLILNSVGELTSTLLLSKLQVLSLLSALSASTTLAISATYRLSLLSNLSASSLQSLQSLLGAELPDDAAVWVVNLDTNASAQYDNYGFNSFFQRGQDYFGVAADGVYKLTGDTDSGVPIAAFAAFIRSSLGIQSVKHIPTAYIGAMSDGGLVLRADVDGIARYYKARTSSTTLQQHRLDLGRGARGVYWEFELMNQNGDDFDLADVTLLPVALDRRI